MELKKGNYFTMDAFMASLLLMTGLLIINAIPADDQSILSQDTITKDLLNTISLVKVSEMQDPIVQEWITNGTIERQNNSILVQSGEFWASNQTSKASYLLNTFLNSSFTGNELYNIRLTMAGDTIYSNNNTPIELSNNIITSRRMVTGVQKGSAITGSTASAYLRKVKDKRTSSFVYFGGFVGQGNITVIMDDVPMDVNSSDITQIIIEADAGKAFDLYINSQFCDSLTPNYVDGVADQWDISSCNSSMISGSNTFQLLFNDLNDAYLAGGYIKASYKTDEFITNSSYGKTVFRFAGINGIVNLFDSFYVPGNLTSMNLYLHYFADNTFNNNTYFLTIGNETVYTDTNSTTEQSIYISDLTLNSLLDYSQFNKNTIPVRTGFVNLTYSVSYTGVADVVLVTDESGSMDWRMDADSVNGVERTCEDPNLYNSNTQRMSIAKCLDKQFAYDIVNISGNLLGLVSYATSTDLGQLVSLTTDLTLINNTVNAYNPNGNTCICCGINSARDEIIKSYSSTTLISAGSSWKYNNSFYRSLPPNDADNNTWYSRNYNDTSWNAGSAILGYDAGGSGPAINTDMGIGPIADTNYYNFPEPADGDELTNVVEFSNSYVSSGNTYGIGGASDGWDYGGAYNFDSNDVNYMGVVVPGTLTFDFGKLPWVQNYCNNRDCSGGWGINIDINNTLYDIIAANGSATLSFDYSWRGRTSNPFESDDELWIKGRFVSPNSGSHDLGTEQSSSGGDSTPEIDRVNNPDTDIDDSYQIEISPWIESTGTYYLELGAKLLASATDEYGNVSFDNIELKVTNESDFYYLRKHFNIPVGGLSNTRRGVLNLMYQDDITVYVNDNLVYSNNVAGNGTYWDARGLFVDGNYFREGDNVVAVRLKNSVGDARFDLELLGINNSRSGALMIMTDGVANRQCAEQGTGDSSLDAIQASCDAAEDWGILSFAVGYSNSADEFVLGGIAECGNGKWVKSSDVSTLGTFYQDTAIEIAEISRQSQTIVITQGTPTESIIYPDSYIELNYEPDYAIPEPDELSVRFQTPPFNGCVANFTIPNGMRVIDAVATSYSGPHWTSYVSLDNQSVFNLSSYNEEFLFMGDPYIVQVPPSLLNSGQHGIEIFTGDGPENYTLPCSNNNTLIYTALIAASTPRSDVVEYANGCVWSIEFEDGSFINEPIPSDYSGNNSCSYTNTSINYNPVDAYDVATYQIFSQLDFDDDGRVLINIDTEDLEIIVTLVSQVPFLWGPAIIQAEAWS